MRANKIDRSAWHDGELAVRERVGVRLSGDGLHSSISGGAAQFLAQQRLAVFASVDADGRMWASLRIGEPGLVRALDDSTVQTKPLSLDGDPLIENLRKNPDVGLVVIDPSVRRRMRINGVAEIMADDSLRIRAQQVYGNCQQYIQERIPEKGRSDATAGFVSRGAQLSDEQQEWIARADTFFIASAHPENGADASHRGGNPGFIKVASAKKLVIPDYHGNLMFNTLGNLIVYPRAGLVFPDFERGRTLQLAGRVTIEWDFDRATFPRAERLLNFEIDEAVEMKQPGLKSYAFKSYSPFNPPVL